MSVYWGVFFIFFFFSGFGCTENAGSINVEYIYIYIHPDIDYSRYSVYTWMIHQNLELN